MRLAIITTHPIQYYAPVFRLMHQRQKINIKVFYTSGEFADKRHDPGFGKAIEWDLPLLEGYPYEWAKNTSADPGSHHRKGIINPEILQQINSYQPNAVLVYGWAYVSHLQVLRYYKGRLPVYFRGDSTLLDSQSFIKSVIKTLYLKWVYRHVDHAFYTGINNKAYFKKYGLKDQQLTFAPHAVDNTRFAENKTTEVAQVKAALNINLNDIIILFAGKLEPKKAPDLLLEAFIKINQPGAHLLFVGNGILEKALKNKAGVRANVHFLDFKNQTDMPVIYQACDIFCLPSNGPAETWGLAINEAMACSKAILASDKVGCAVDLVRKENGLIFKAKDTLDLQIKLTSLTNMGKAKLNDMGVNSLHIIEQWNFENQVTSIETALLASI